MAASKEKYMELYQYMILGRLLEERLETLYKQGKLPGAIYLGRGQEACTIGSSGALEQGDVLAPTHRDMIAMLPRGMDPKLILAQHFGKATSPTHGRGEADYLGDLSKGIFATVSMLPDFYPVAAGAAFAFKYRGEKKVALAYCGEGASSRGDWHEAMNFAAVLNVPVVFFVINNQFAYSTPTRKEMTVTDVAQRAAGYDMHGVTVDGNDVRAVYEATKSAVDRARAGGGPTLIEGKTMRMRGHAGHDPADYVPKEVLEEWEAKDPILQFEKYLTSEGWLDTQAQEQIRQEALEQIADAVNFAQDSPMPTGGEEVRDVFH